MFLTESIETQETAKGVGSLAEILFEAEAQYGNLCLRMATIEHKAIVTEDAQLMAEGIDGYWETFVAWAKKWFAKFKAFFASLWDKITAVFTSDENWLKKIEKENPAYGKVEDISLYPSVADGSVAGKVKAMFTVLDGGFAMSTALPKGDESVVAYSKRTALALLKVPAGADDSVSEKVKEHVLGGEEATKTTIADGKKYVTLFGELIELGKKVKDLRKGIEAAEKKAVDAAGKKNKIGAELAKNDAFILSAALSAATSALGTARGQAKSAILASMAAGRKNNVKAVHGESSLFEGTLV